MTTIPDDIESQAKELGQRALKNMDPLCEKHLHQLPYHPLDAEFRNTRIYSEFEDLLIDYAEREGYDWEECSATIRDELRWELREAFDLGYFNPSETVECQGCLEDGDIQIRVNDSDSVSAEEFLDGHVQSGNVKEDKHDWR